MRGVSPEKLFCTIGCTCGIEFQGYLMVVLRVQGIKNLLQRRVTFKRKYHAIDLQVPLINECFLVGRDAQRNFIFDDIIGIE